MFDFKSNCTNDPNFGSLWGLYNATNPNIDINACQAWPISQGAGINVAIVDTGIDLLHNDLQSNIHPMSYDCQTNTSPSFLRPLNNNFYHGTHVAGTVGAVGNNNLQVVGVAPQSKLMSISHSMIITPTYSSEIASGISWAYQHGADVINNSFGDQGGQYYNEIHSTILENAIINAMTLGRNNLGTLVVFSSGNFDYLGMNYPANFNDNILVVSAINSIGDRYSTSAGGEKLDVIAPGQNILSTMPNNGTDSNSGTSMASPHAAGVCALVLAVNPSLSGQQVRDIIEQTCQKVGDYSYLTTAGRPNGTWHRDRGYGLIDAYAAVQAASCFFSTADLMIKDSAADVGDQPNEITQYMWASTDIWIRRQQDGASNDTHENPIYSPTVPNYIYVRITNRGCHASIGGEQLKFYWAKGGTSLAWPNSWNGENYFPSPYPSPNAFIKLGNIVDTVNIPILAPG
jgi:hypothetical protein